MSITTDEALRDAIMKREAGLAEEDEASEKETLVFAENNGKTSSFKVNAVVLSGSTAAAWEQFIANFTNYVAYYIEVDLGDGSLDWCIEKGLCDLRGTVIEGATVPWTKEQDLLLATMISAAVSQHARAVVIGQRRSGVAYWVALCAHFNVNSLQACISQVRKAAATRCAITSKATACDEFRSFEQKFLDIYSATRLPSAMKPKDIMLLSLLLSNAPRDAVPGIEDYVNRVLQDGGQASGQAPTIAGVLATMRGIITSWATMGSNGSDFTPPPSSNDSTAALLAALGSSSGSGQMGAPELLSALLAAASGNRKKGASACFGCGRKGHGALECRVPFEEWPEGWEKAVRSDKLRERIINKKNNNQSSDSLYSVTNIPALASLAAVEKKGEQWQSQFIFDCGTTHVLVRDLADLSQAKHLSKGEQLHFTGGNAGSAIVGIATGKLNLTLRAKDGSKVNVVIERAVWTPVLPTRGLLGKRPLELAGVYLYADGEGGPWVLKTAGKTLPLIELQNGLATLPTIGNPAQGGALVAVERNEFHARLGHAVTGQLLERTANAMENITLSGDRVTCLPCDLAKARRNNTPKGPHSIRAVMPAQYIVVDLIGHKERGIKGFTSALVAHDVATGVDHVAFLKGATTEDIVKAFDTVLARIAADQLSFMTARAEREGTPLSELGVVEQLQARGLNGMTILGDPQFDISALHNRLHSKGINLRHTASGEHEVAGHAESAIKQIWQSAVACLNNSKLPMRFWPYAVNMVAEARRRTVRAKATSAMVGKSISPHECVTGYKPSLPHTFGCLVCYTEALPSKPVLKSKAADRGKLGIYLGPVPYSEAQHGLSFVHSLDTQQVVRRRTVKAYDGVQAGLHDRREDLQRLVEENARAKARYGSKGNAPRAAVPVQQPPLESKLHGNPFEVLSDPNDNDNDEEDDDANDANDGPPPSSPSCPSPLSTAPSLYIDGEEDDDDDGNDANDGLPSLSLSSLSPSSSSPSPSTSQSGGALPSQLDFESDGSESNLHLHPQNNQTCAKQQQEEPGEGGEERAEQEEDALVGKEDGEVVAELGTPAGAGTSDGEGDDEDSGNTDPELIISAGVGGAGTSCDHEFLQPNGATTGWEKQHCLACNKSIPLLDPFYSCLDCGQVRCAACAPSTTRRGTNVRKVRFDHSPNGAALFCNDGSGAAAEQNGADCAVGLAPSSSQPRCAKGHETDTAWATAATGACSTCNTKLVQGTPHISCKPCSVRICFDCNSNPASDNPDNLIQTSASFLAAKSLEEAEEELSDGYVDYSSKKVYDRTLQSDPVEVPESSRDLKHLTERDQILWALAEAYEWEGMARTNEAVDLTNTYTKETAERLGETIQGLWVYVKKLGGRLKARYAARGDNEKDRAASGGAAPTISYALVFMLIIYGLALQYKPAFLDCPQAYLKAKLFRRRLFLRAPACAGFPEGTYLEILKAIYGLYDSGRSWFEYLVRRLRQIGLTQSTWHPCLWFGDGIFVAIFVDDLVVMHRDDEALLSLRSKLKSAGVPTTHDDSAQGHLLGMRYNMSQGSVAFDFGEKEADLIQQVEAASYVVQPRKVPAIPGSTLKPAKAAREGGAPSSNPLYRQFVGSLLHISKIRMEIKNAVRELCRHLEHNDETHWEALMQVVGYLKQVPGLELRLKAVNLEDCRLAVWVDASWGNDKVDLGSAGGHALTLGGQTFQTSSKQLQTIQRSSAEAEALAASEGGYEGQFFTRVLRELGLRQEVVPVIMDSRAAMDLIRRPMLSGRSKHLDIRRLWLRQAVDEQQFELWWASSEEELADILTKNLGRPAFEQFRARLLNHTNLESIAMSTVNAKEGCCSVGAENLAMAMGLTARPDAKPVPTLQADHWTRWLQPPTHNDDVDIELGTQDAITVLLASLGRCVTASQGGWVQKRTSFLERQDEDSQQGRHDEDSHRHQEQPPP